MGELVQKKNPRIVLLKILDYTKHTCKYQISPKNENQAVQKT